MTESFKYYDAAATRPGSIKAKDRTVDVVMSTPDVDRDGEVVLPRAFEETIGEFKRNPVVFFNHARQEAPPIGHVIPETIKISDTALEGTVQIRKEGRDPLADRVWNAVEDGVLRTVSIGFRVRQIEEKPNQPLRIIKADLMELSLVNVPANPYAPAKALREQVRSLKESAVATVDDLDILRLAAARIERRTWDGKGDLGDIAEAIDQLRAALDALPMGEEEREAHRRIEAKILSGGFDAAMRKIRAI